MLNINQLKQVLELTSKNLKKYPSWRLGQSFYNSLWDLLPDLASTINGTKYDPFYQDSIIENTISFLFDEESVEYFKNHKF